ncbi:uncharacterized protein LOC108864504 [Galendromus occidentalis]|uniref:Uncharacterized protein LOC108864504 n=1 Tax=Galendromus occidentalis TaxID=34638 RepID=A0AAJ7PA76_9ACAR|nr:uncharacterized protein LOC108864504 [Galendromus occidentalis]
MSAKLRRRLEILQREAGRWALGELNANPAKEFIDGQLGWSIFEAREAKGELIYRARINEMSETMWPKAIQTMMKIANIPIKLPTRSLELEKTFGCKSIREMPRSTLRVSLGVNEKYVNETIKNKLDQDWVEGMFDTKVMLEEWVQRNIDNPYGQVAKPHPPRTN